MWVTSKPAPHPFHPDVKWKVGTEFQAQEIRNYYVGPGDAPNKAVDVLIRVEAEE
jgi:hypothetical protein